MGGAHLYRHNTLKNDFMFLTVPEWDEDEEWITYDIWMEMQLNEINDLTSSKLTSIEEEATDADGYQVLYHLQ